MNVKYIKLFLRLALSSAFLSAVADRLGYWPDELSAWGNWEAFEAYTQSINPWFPKSTIPIVAIVATVLEVLFALLLLVGFKTELIAKLSGLLLLLFALAISIAYNVKGAFDYSVYSAAAAAFALSTIHSKYLELDSYLSSSKE
ncbi:DoxX family membrane protein [Muricauda sp. 2012CJ35-5]|uniref:DoxX family membrane protein n=1 Tax=Flagellimonas spongiicola TaxID=2942208 RepID=A0ABT0PU40_9FLAO|nr:MauE/DoxX family redox-associated membrane protein [Allomuricauda spongiicola]MCL6274904.1 DoxX family membrane protein [Allomuricauda spongiicola]